MEISVLTVDDHALFRHCMVDYLDSQDDITVAGQASSPEQGFTMAMELEPDITLVDLDLGGRDGMQLAEKIINQLPSATVVILTAYKEEDQMARALQIGAKGYLTKDIAPDEMVNQLRKIMRKQVIYPQNFLLNRARSSLAGDSGSGSSSSLTPRELEVLHNVSDGKTDKEIARILSISEHTIKNHMKSIRKKLGASNRIQASLKGIDLGIIKR